MHLIKQIVIIRKLDDTSNPRVTSIENVVTEFGNANIIPVKEIGKPGSEPDLHLPTLLISIGGDGTMLYAAKESLKFDRAYVLGVNAGNLGFLTDTFSEYQLDYHLKAILDADITKVKLDKRNVLYVEYTDNAGSIQTAIALNEVFVTAQKNHAPIQYDINVNFHHVAKQTGSGVMVATATGSTAFALSSGGSIMNPTTSAMQIVPVNAHSLTARPVVLSGSRDEVRISVPVTARVGGIELQVDGQNVQTFTNSVEPFSMQIKIHDKVVKIIRTTDWSFFETLSQKLGWK